MSASSVSPAKVALLLERAGRSRYFEGALPLLRSAGIEIVPITLAPRGELHEALEELGFKTHSVGFERFASYPGAARRLAAILRTERPQLIDAHELIPATVACLARSFGREGRIAFHRHHAEASGLQGFFSRIASRFSDCTIAVSQTVFDAAISLDGVAPSRVLLALNGIPDLRPVEEAEGSALRAGLGIASSAFVVVAVARLRLQKGLTTVLEALEQFGSGSANCDVHLVIVGDGPEAGSVSDEVVARRIEQQVHLVGHQEDVAPWYAIADVVAIPSLFEAFGLVAIEAAAASRAVLASNVGGLREIVVNGSTGLLVPAGRPASIIEGLRRLMADRGERERMGSNARRRYEESFTVGEMVSGWIDAYASILS
jgi:glycosyltransferase involved in cell wall biosynthesis